MTLKIYNITTKLILKEKIEISDTYFKRLKGLMFKKDFNNGMLFKNLNLGSSIHSCFMLFTIEVYFVDENNKIYEKTILKPWKSYKPQKKAKYIIEYKKSSKERFKIGDQIKLINR